MVELRLGSESLMADVPGSVGRVAVVVGLVEVADAVGDVQKGAEAGAEKDLSERSVAVWA